MKSKKKKRLLILIGILMICLLPISFLSKVLVPWAEELGEVTTEAGAALPGDATVTDAANDPAIDVGRTLLSGIQNGSVKYTDLSVEQAVQVVKAILCSKEDFAWFCSLDDSQAKKIFSVDKRRIQFEFETLMKDNTDMSFVKDMSVEDYDKFFGTTEGKSVISTVMNGKTVDATAAADGGFNMNITSCAPGHEGILQILPLGKHYVHCIEGGHYVSGSNKPPYGWMEVNGSKFYLMCGNDNKEINSFFAFSTKSIEAEEWEISVAFPSATQMYFDYYWTKKGGAQPSNEVPDRDFHDALGKLMEGVGSTSSYNGKSYAYPGSWNDVIRSERYKVFDADTGAELNSSSLLEMSVVDGQQITHKLRFETGTSYFGTTITVPQGTVFHYYQGANQYDVVGGQRVTVPNGTIGYFYAPLSTNGVIAAETVSAGWYVETTYRFECKGKPVQISTGKRLPVQQLLCPITKQPSLNFSIKAATTSHVALKKTSSKRDIVDESTGETKVKAENYSVDTPLTHSDGTPVIDSTTGKQVVAKAGTAKAIRISVATGKDGKIDFNGLFPAKNADDYYVVELCAPKDFYRDKTEHPVDLRDNRTDAEKSNVNYTALSKHLDVTNQPIMQPIHVKKYVPVKDGNTTKIEPLNGAEFSVYLISSLKGDISACKVTNADGSVSYNFKSYDFSNETGEVVTDDGERVLVTGSGDNDDGEVTSIDLMPGTYVIVETKTPEGYETVDPMVVTLPRYRKDSAGNFVLDANGDPKIYATTSVSPTDMQIEKYLKINKKDKSTNEFVLQNKAKFSIWDISGADSSEYSKDPKTYGKQVTQQRQTESGYTDVSVFETNDEGFLLLFEAFKYGEYTIVEEEAPTGYDKDDNITFSVRQDGIYLWARNQWVKAETYSNKVGDTEYDFWEVNFYDAPFSLEIAKADWETGDWVPNAELTIYKAMDKAGHIAIGEDGKPVVLVARDESGKDVEAAWVTSAGIKRFDKVPSGWYVIRETKTPTQEGYATCPDRVVYVGNDETIAPNGKMTISGDETVYFSFTYDDDGVTIANVPEYEADTKNGKVALYDKPITVEISKIDAATEKELPGAVLTLYRVDEDEDTVIETWTSTKTSHVVKYLTPGRYKLHEDTVPLGYYTTENTIEFDVSNTEEIQKCVMVNHPIEVTFDKQSINLGGTSLPGATLALYRISEGPAFATATDATASDASSSDATVSDASNSDADGLQLVKRWVTDGKPYTIKYLTPGDYRLIEEKTPEGYTTAASIDFNISDQKAAEAIVMYDEPIKCYVQIFKHGEMLTKTEIVDCEYGKYTKFKWEDAPMSQISFDVYDEDGNLVDTIVTNENGTGVSKDLAFGSYKIKERVPDGWVDKHVVYNVKFTWLQGMTETNLTASVTVNNESCNTQININKVGEEAVLNSKGEYEYVEKPLKGVLFGIYAKDAIKDYSGKEIAAADTCVGYAVTDSNGVASCDSKLVRGEYYYKELKTAGPQYVMDEDLHPFTLILANSKISTFNVNETLPIKNVLARGNIKVLKVNKDGRAPLAGAEFDVFNADGKIVDHLVTGADGTAMTKVLPYGKYSLRETKAPTGFVLSKAAFDTEIIANGDVPLLEITNSTITKLGSKGIFIVVGLAVIFAGLVTVICFKLRRK